MSNHYLPEFPHIDGSSQEHGGACGNHGALFPTIRHTAQDRDIREAAPAPNAILRSTVGERTAALIVQQRSVPGGRPPYGYITAIAVTQNGHVKCWEINEPQAADVRQIFAMASSASGRRLSCAKIARSINRTATKRRFDAMAVHRILTDQVYTGRSTRCVSKRAGTFVVMITPPLVSEDIFWTARTHLTFRRRLWPKKPTGGVDE